jgi:hypothetical protein
MARILTTIVVAFSIAPHLTASYVRCEIQYFGLLMPIRNILNLSHPTIIIDYFDHWRVYNHGSRHRSRDGLSDHDVC